MDENVGKIYCLDRGNDDALAAAICKQTGELRNGQRDLGVAITQGFSQVGYQQGQDKCEILSLDG